VLLFLGRLHPKKGLRDLIAAWAIEQKATDAPWTLVIAGWDQGGHRAELEALVSSLNTGSTVFFVGPQHGNDKNAILHRSDAFVLPSLSEGLPMAVLEAWAHRLPVLMTPQCNLPEGFACEAALPMNPDVNAIREALRTLFGMSQSELAQMGARGRSLVEDRFSWDKIATEMSAVYDWVLGGGSAPDCVRLE
jgi:poly(glycerol-phosphate) alpha-glucosyltransferase